MDNFYNKKTSQLLELILQGNKQSDEAVYYLLQDRLYKKFEEKFNVQSNKNNEDLADVLDKSNALPDKEMAEAMGMSHVLYRVTTHRIMQSVAIHKKNIESGVKFNLDSYHTTMAECINNDFDTLYSTLIRYYDSTLCHLENVSAIRKLRKEYYNTTGVMLHEDIADYGSLSIYGFCNKLNR